MATRDETLRFLIEAKGSDELKRLASEMDKLAKSGDVAEEDISQFVSELDKLARIDKSITALTRLKSGLTETGTSLEKAKARVAELEKQLSTAGAPTAKLAKDLDRARAAVDNLTKEQNRQRAALDQTSGSLKKAGVDTERLGSAQRQVRQDITALTERFGSYAARVREAGANNERLAKSTGDLAKSAKAANTDLAGVELGLGKIAAAAGAAVAAFKGIQFSGNLVGQAAALEQSLANVQAVSGATAEDFGRLRKAAEDAAASTGISIGAVTEGLAELARTGLDANGVIATLKPTLDLAQAGNIALAQAVEITATTLTQFGLGAEQAGRVADVLAQTANATQSSVEGLGRSLTDVAPLAKQLNIPFEETVAILGKLSDEGFKGSRAGTSLRAAFTQLLDPSTKFREELSKLGITSTDFTTVLEELATKGDAGRNAILALGQEAAPAILALAGKGGGAIRALTADLGNAAGAAEQVASVIRDTLGNAFDRLSNTAGNAITQLIDPLLKPLQLLLEDVAARVQAFAESADFEKIRAGLSEAFTQGIELLRELIDSANFASLTQQVQEFTEEAGARFRGLRGDIDSIVAAFDAIAAALRVVFNGIRAEVAGFNRDIAGFKRLAKEAELALLEYSSIFRENAEFRAEVQREINELIAEEARLSGDRKQSYRDLEVAADDFGNAIGRIGARVEEVGKQGSLIEGLGDALRAAAEGLKGVSTEAAAAEADIGSLGVATTEAAAGIEEGNKRAARSFELTGDAAVRARLAIVENFEKARAELETKANEIALSIARGLEAGADTSALQAELQQVQGQLTETDRKLAQARSQFGALGDVGENAGRRISGSFAGAAKSVGEAGRAAEVSRDGFGRLADGAKRAENAVGALTGAVGGAIAAAARVDAKFAEAETAVKSFYDSLNANVDRDFGSLGGAQLVADLQKFIDGVADAGAQAEIYQQQLSTLRAASKRGAEQFARELEETTARSRAAVDELSGILQQQQDELDRASGNERNIIDRQYQQQLARINELAASGTAEALAQADKARKALTANYQRRIRELRDESEAAKSSSAAIVRADNAAADNRARIANEEQARFQRELQRGAGDQLNVSRQLELVVRNEQKPGGVLSELSEADLRRLAQQVLGQVAGDGRGVFG